MTSRNGQEAEGFLGALALISTAAALMCLGLVVALLGFRSGLGTPPSLLILCAAIVVSAAYAPFLLPHSQHGRLDRARFVYPLLMLAVMFSPILQLWLPSRLGYVYLVTGVAGILRAVPYLGQSDWRTLAAVGVASGVMALHLLTAQGLHASAFLPEHWPWAGSPGITICTPPSPA